MDAAIQKMQEAGFTLAVVNGALRVSPADKLTDQHREYLRAHKAELIAALSAANDPLELIHWRDCTPEQLRNLWTRVKRGEPVQIFSDTFDESVWWVRDEALVTELKRRGITEVCYTIAELQELAGKPAEFLQDIHAMKKRFSATLVKAHVSDS